MSKKVTFGQYQKAKKKIKERKANRNKEEKNYIVFELFRKAGRFFHVK